MQYARVWYIDSDGDRCSDEFQFPDGFPNDGEMQEWAEEISESNGGSLDYWEEIEQEEFMEATGL